MSIVLRLGLGISLLAAAAARPQPQFDQLLENIGPILQEAEAYHSPGEPGESAEPLALTLDRCVELALEQNVDVLVAETEVAVQAAKTGQAKSRRLPHIRSDAIYNYVEELDFGIDAGLLGGFIDTESFSPEKETVTTRLGVTQVLFAGGQIHNAILASKFLAASQGWRRDAVREEVAFRARQAYHDALAARAGEAVAGDAREAFARHLRDTEILKNEGVLTEYEVMRARTEVAARDADLVAARANVQRADLNLRRILALPEDQPLTYDPAIPPAPAAAPAPDLIEAAREHRPELHALQNALAAAEKQERGVIGKYLPQASASATWVNVDGGGQSTPDGWQVNVGAQWDLYLGGQRKHERAEARARSESLRYQLADMERLVALDVEQACIRLQETTAAMRASKDNVDLAVESMRLAEIRYREGIGTQTEIIDSELERTRAKSALVAALRDYHVACAALRRATGTSVNAPEAQAQTPPEAPSQ